MKVRKLNTDNADSSQDQLQNSSSMYRVNNTLEDRSNSQMSNSRYTSIFQTRVKNDYNVISEENEKDSDDESSDGGGYVEVDNVEIPKIRNQQIQ